MHRFYINLDFQVGSSYQLPIEVIRHINVLRIKNIHCIEVFNGNGFNYRAKFEILEKRKCVIKVIDEYLANTESSLQIILLMSLVANDKFDLVLQKSVELGVTQFIPIITQNTQNNFSEDKILTKMLHWQNVIIAATEQSRRAVLMQLHQPKIFTDIIPHFQNIPTKYILSPYHAGKINGDLFPQQIVACVGPEGGFTNDEITCANGYGFKSVLLGPRILRAETAAISILSLVQHVFGDL